MPPKSKTTYEDQESEFLETTLKELKKYLESINISKLEDRFKGSKLIEKKENIRKDYFSALKEYADLYKVVRSLREVEVNKREVRGDQELTPFEEGVI